MLKTFPHDLETLGQVLFLCSNTSIFWERKPPAFGSRLPLETGHHGNRIPVSKIRTETVEPSPHASSPPGASPVSQSLPPSQMHAHMDTLRHTHAHTWLLRVELLPFLFPLQGQSLWVIRFVQPLPSPHPVNWPLHTTVFSFSLLPTLVQTWSEVGRGAVGAQTLVLGKIKFSSSFYSLWAA